MRVTAALGAAALGLWLAGCTGEVGGGGTSPPGSDPPGTTPGTTPGPIGPPPGQCAAPAPARIWRLSHTEYDNTVRALLGTTGSPAAAFEPQSSGSGFKNGSDAAYTSARLADDYSSAAEKLSAAAAADLGKLLPCTPADPANTMCVQGFIERFGKRAFRQALSPAQKTLYFDLYMAGRATSPKVGVEMVIEAMLQSPYFIYRTELGGTGNAGQAVALTPHEMAAQLSYLLWENMPDDALLAKADMGMLSSPQQVAAELDRMLADPRAQGVLWRFFAQYFDLDLLPDISKSATGYPTFTPALADALGKEAEAFVNHVVWKGAGTLAELLSADYTLATQAVAAHYGLSGVTGTAPQKVTFTAAAPRSGLLTQGGVMAVHAKLDASSPTLRGLFVRNELLCQHVPEPPPNVADTVEPPNASKTTRQRYEDVHLAKATTCLGCHTLLDPIGFGFENYDGIGRYRATENNQPVNATGEVVATREINGKFNGAVELGKRLAGSKEVSACTTATFFRYAMGRSETMQDACVIEGLNKRMEEPGARLIDLVKALSQTDAFVRRVKI